MLYSLNNLTRALNVRLFWILKFNFITSTRTPMRCWVENTSVSFECSRYTNKNFVSLIYLLTHTLMHGAHTHLLTRWLVHCRMLKIEKRNLCLLTLRKFSRLAQDRMCARCSLNDVTLISYNSTHHSIYRLKCEWWNSKFIEMYDSSIWLWMAVIIAANLFRWKMIIAYSKLWNSLQTLP